MNDGDDRLNDSPPDPPPDEVESLRVIVDTLMPFDHPSRLRMLNYVISRLAIYSFDLTDNRPSP